jgi:hypothetical protein
MPGVTMAPATSCSSFAFSAIRDSTAATRPFSEAHVARRVEAASRVDHPPAAQNQIHGSFLQCVKVPSLPLTEVAGDVMAG